jgi:hypothetical protein
MLGSAIRSLRGSVANYTSKTAGLYSTSLAKTNFAYSLAGRPLVKAGINKLKKREAREAKYNAIRTVRSERGTKPLKINIAPNVREKVRTNKANFSGKSTDRIFNKMQLGSAANRRMNRNLATSQKATPETMKQGYQKLKPSENVIRNLRRRSGSNNERQVAKTTAQARVKKISEVRKRREERTKR